MQIPQDLEAANDGDDGIEPYPMKDAKEVKFDEILEAFKEELYLLIDALGWAHKLLPKDGAT